MRTSLALAAVGLLAACAQAPVREAARPAAHRPLPPQPVADLIVVDKSDRAMWVYSGGVEMRRYAGLQFGADPVGPKRFEGDERTPEGRYRIDARNPASAYHLSLRISYPNDRDYAYASEVNLSPGGDIFIHGQPNGLAGRAPGDWTDGCIALSNAEIEELWALVPDGTDIEIRP